MNGWVVAGWDMRRWVIWQVLAACCAGHIKFKRDGEVFGIQKSTAIMALIRYNMFDFWRHMVYNLFAGTVNRKDVLDLLERLPFDQTGNFGAAQVQKRLDVHIVGSQD